uniref:Hybrid signal transduction histidine kinase M n=1 Tax=Tanacetum cinerariifolium TaxID=118510 RepID=A0A699KSD8_TANCI|nr:hybrid signal transduction histidine kinase M [Tanacetum cinerariifolium]
MTGFNTTSVILLSDKLSTVTHHHLLIQAIKYIHGSSNNATTSTPTPLTSEELKVDTIVLSWICLAILRSLKLGDLTIDAYFIKIESIAIILTSLKSPVISEDVVTFTLEGFPDKYENFGDACKFIHDAQVKSGDTTGVTNG